MTALVSVLMTAYNAGRYLPIAIDSLLSQSFQGWQLILIDNGSTDASFDALELGDDRIKIFHLPSNIGRTAALNMAFAKSDTQFTAILDADDVAMPDRLELQLAVFDAFHDVVLVGSGYSQIFEGRSAVRRLRTFAGIVHHDRLGERNIFVNSSLMYRTNAAKGVGGYDPLFTYAQDFDLTLKLAVTGQCFMIDKSLVGVRLHQSSLTNSRGIALKRLDEEAQLFKLAATKLKLSPLGRRLNLRRQALVQVELGVTLLRIRLIATSLRAFGAAFRLDPSLSWIIYLLKGRRIPRF